MEYKTVLNEVSGAEDVKALEGCTITTVAAASEDGEGLCIDCKDDYGNLVSLLITEEGSFHFYNGAKKSITTEQLGEIAMLIGCSDIYSVYFHNADPVTTEIVIKVIGDDAADRVLTLIKGFFPNSEISEDKWEFEGELQPKYQCIDSSCDLMIIVPVMTKDPRNIQ